MSLIGQESTVPLGVFIYLHELTLMGVAIRCSYCRVGSVEPIIQVLPSTVRDHYCALEREKYAEWKKQRTRR